jgi:uncharacterized iron-regulated membrane protein
MTFRKIIGKIHLWLGLIAGSVVIVSMLAAALFVWEEELTDWYYGDRAFVANTRDERLPLDTLLTAAQASVPGRDVTFVEIFQDPGRSYIFRSYKKAERAGFSYMSSIAHQDEIYVDQYSGKVLGVVDKRYDWIYMTRMLHQCLLINYDIGHLVVGISTLVVIAMLLTGLVLWWPRNSAAMKQRFTIKWKARWRRINYDVHNVGGFYMYLLILLFAVTGLVWTFDWWTNGIYRILGNDPEQVFAKHEPPKFLESEKPGPAQKVLADVAGKREHWTGISLSFPKATSETPGEFSAFVRYDANSGWDVSDSYYYHGQTGELYHTKVHDEKLLGEKWRNSNYAIHVGSIYGLPTKILACFSALFLASLPVTGFCIWMGRRVKSEKKVLKRGISSKPGTLQKAPRVASKSKIYAADVHSDVR